MASTIVIPNRERIANYEPELANALIEGLSAAKADIDGITGTVDAAFPSSYRKDAADALAADLTAERCIGLRATTSQVVNKAYWCPDAALTADNTNYATIKLWKRDANGATQVLVASGTTQITGMNSFTAFKPVALTLSAVSGATTLAAGSTLTFEVTKTGTGVVLGAGALYVERTVSG